MLNPDQRLFESDLLAAEFLAGAAKNSWGLTDGLSLPISTTWPKVFLWVAAAPRPSSPNRFHLQLDATGYRNVPPTGTLWDPSTKSSLAFSLFPKGKAGGRVAMVFRTDRWASMNPALYHPYDRVAAQGHRDWPEKYPHLLWDANHTIVDCLDEIHKLLHSGEYLGA